MGSSIRLEGDTRKLLRKLRALSELDKRKLGRVLASAIRSSTLDRFKAGKDPEGKAWPSSLRARELGGKTLIDTARLRNSIQSRSGAEGFAVGTNTIYAATHQYGEKGRKITIKAKTRRGLRFKIDGRWICKQQVTVRVKIPARPFLGLSEEDQKEIQHTVEDWIEEA